MLPVDLDDTEQVAWVFHPDSGPWRDAGFVTRHESVPWWGCRFVPSAARQWVNAGVTSPVQAQQLVENGVTVDRLAAWNEHGFSVDDVIWWTKEDVTDPHDAAVFVSVGMNPSTAGVWTAFGFTATEAAAWKNDHDVDVYTAAALRDRGFNPVTWTQFRVDHRDSIIRLRNLIGHVTGHVTGRPTLQTVASRDPEPGRNER